MKNKSQLKARPALNLHRASEQLDLIWRVVSRQQVFRGYRPATVAVTGFFGFLAAWLQGLLIDWDLPRAAFHFVDLWVGVAIVSLMVISSDLAFDYTRHRETHRRQLTWQAVFQFLPALFAGGILVVANIYFDAIEVSLLPGLWSLCLALGIFSSLPYLPRAVLWIGIFYLLAGVVGLYLAPSDWSLSPWMMGCTFGMGQGLAAWVLGKSGKYDG